MRLIMKYTNFFSQLTKNDVTIAGGKGASLGEMFNSHIPVPDGFVVLSEAFEKFLAQAHLIKGINDVLKSVDYHVPSAVDKASEKIRGLISSHEIPPDIKKEIVTCFKMLNAKLVAVRSSATAEDSGDLAWAGQLETYLNVNEDDVPSKVKKCWSSLFTPRAIFYRFKNKLNTSKISVAVVIQKMVNAQKAGTAFSVHPVSEDPNQIIIEAAHGLGEAVVSGSVTPDSYIVEKKSKKIITTNKTHSRQVLTENEILALSEIVLKIERHYGFPCDIEWAFENGAFYITQSRPITTLGKTSAPPSLSKNLKKLFAREYSVQYCECSLRSLPLFSQCYLPEKGNQAVYFDENEWRDFQTHLQEIVDDEEKTERFLSDFHLYGQKYLAVAREVSRGALGKIKNEELVSRYKRYIKLLNLYSSYLWRGFYLNDLISKHASSLLTQKNIPKKDYDAVFTALFSPSKKSGVLLLQEELSDKKRSGKTSLSNTELTDLLNEYAWMSCLDVHNDPWDKKEISQYYKELKATVPTMMSYDSAIKRASLSNDERRLFDTVREFVFVKDMRDIYRRKAVYAALPLFDEIARRFHISRSDLAYFSNNEIITGLLGKKSPAEVPYKHRKTGFLIYWKAKKVVVSTEQKTIDTIYNKVITDDTAHEKVSGAVACRGNVSGPAKIISTVADLTKVKKGDILIAVTTHPDFISAMHRAAAFVTDEGGLTSHAAIIAREMKKPCIVGTKRATDVFKDGDMVRVNGEKGIIELV